MNGLMLASVLSMAGLAIIFAGVLAFADKKLRVEEDPMVDKINHLLPGVNCGACGCLSCHDFAEHIAAHDADPGKCRVISEEVREELYELTGAEEGAALKSYAIVHCSADCEHKEPVAEYKGVRSCRAANLAFGGSMQCQYGCMGYGDCFEACPFGAIVMENGLPEIVIDKCTGCGKCAEACPRNVITIEDKRFEKLFYVACSSHDTALRVRKICGVGCIGCGICEKLSEGKLFVMKDKLSYPDYSKQSDAEELEKIQAKCPPKVIKDI